MEATLLQTPQAGRSAEEPVPSAAIVLQQLPSNHQPLDLTGPLVDLRDAGIAVVALRGHLGHVAHPAQDLERLAERKLLPLGTAALQKALQLEAGLAPGLPFHQAFTAEVPNFFRATTHPVPGGGAGSATLLEEVQGNFWGTPLGSTGCQPKPAA